MSSLTTTAVAWLWEKYGKSVTDKTTGAVKDKWSEFKWKEAAEKYRAKIKKLYGTMQIMGMAEPVPLDDIFTDAYMFDKPTAFGRFDIERLKQLSADPDAPPPQAERINGLRLVREKGNLFILGKPGAGKTTFLKYIALQAAEQNIDKIPIFVTLKHWADSGLDLMPFIVERFDTCDFPDARPFVEELLKSGRAIVLFDGLDEVTQESGQRDEQTREINNLIEKYDRAQYLITCRIAANDYSFGPFTYVEIADFTKSQSKKFVANWFRNDKETCTKFLAEFEKEENKDLRELARTPLLSTLLCLAFSETLTFPQRRVEIYEEALDALLKKWDASRGIKRGEVYRKLSLGHKKNMLARIAAETFENNEYFITQSELERLITDYVKNIPPHAANEGIDGRVILKAIEAQHGIFVERYREIYSFSHLTFQEYYTAKYVVANAAKGTLVNLVKVHAADGRWREVLLLTTSLLPDATQFMRIFQQSINELLADDEELAGLSTGVAEKTALIQTDPQLGQLSYLFIELYYSSRSEALVLALTHILPKVLSLVSTLNRDQARHLALDLALARDYALDMDPARTRDLAVKLALDLGLDHEHVHDLAYSLAHDLGLSVLANELTALSLPSFLNTAALKKEFTDKVRTLAIRHRNIGRGWNLTEEQEERLTDYLKSTDLLQDCLEVATISPEDKKAILNSLYLPPAQAVFRENA